MTAAVKDELCRLAVVAPAARRAELSALLRFAGGLHLADGRVVVQAELDASSVARRVRRELFALLGAVSDVHVTAGSGPRCAPRFVVRVTRDGESLARRTGLIDGTGRPVRGLPPALLAGSVGEAPATWRGAFLARGSVTKPGRSCALELACPGPEAALAMVGAARRLGIAARTREARGTDRLVVRDSNAISLLLARMGAHEGQQQQQQQQQQARPEARAAAPRQLSNFKVWAVT